MREIKVLIVDDSQMVHLLLEKVTSEDREINIVGNAYNGREGLELIKKQSPDVVVMDIGMPLMDGLEAIQEIMYEHPLPIIVFSAASEKLVDLSFKAIEMGAVDLIEKPVANDLTSLRKNIEENLIRSIKTFADFKVMRRMKTLKIDHLHIQVANLKEVTDRSADKTNELKRPLQPEKSIEKQPSVQEIKGIKQITQQLTYSLVRFPVIGIAASTGGPQSLRTLLQDFSTKKLNAAIVIVQHMADGFMQGFSDWLADYSVWPVRMPLHNDEVKIHNVYVAPGENHLAFNKEGRFSLLNTPPIHGIRPSADIMFSSLGEVYKDRTIAIIMTGMGSDGTIGLHKVKEYRGHIISQDEETSLIFGMPKSAIDAGIVDKILGLSQIAGYVEDFCRERFK